MYVQVRVNSVNYKEKRLIISVQQINRETIDY